MVVRGKGSPVVQFARHHSQAVGFRRSPVAQVKGFRMTAIEVLAFLALPTAVGALLAALRAQQIAREATAAAQYAQYLAAVAQSRVMDKP